jgi:hypothetical protein
LAYLARFRDVLEERTLEQRKEFLRGFVHEISIDSDTARGTITFYELPVTSLMSVPGVRVALLQTPRSKRLDRFNLLSNPTRTGLAGPLTVNQSVTQHPGFDGGMPTVSIARIMAEPKFMTPSP